MSDTSRFFEDSSPVVVKRETHNSDSKNLSQITPGSSSPIQNHDEINIRNNQSLFVSNDEDDDDDGKDDDESEMVDTAYELFESQIKAIITDLDPSKIYTLYLKYKNQENSVVLAVNDFYDELSIVETKSKILASSLSTTTTQRSATSRPNTYPTRSSPLSSILKTRPSSQINESSSPITKRPKTQERREKSLSPNVQWKRFIGTTQVVAWATRPTVKPVPYGTQLDLVKTSSNSGAPRRGRNGITTSVSSFMKLVQDNDDVSKRKEIGRVPEDIASILFPLIDQDLCDFDVTCVFCDGRLSTGDSFIVQIDCYLTSRIFDSVKNESSYEDELKQMRFSQSFNKTAFETQNEQQQHRRQVALMKLFDKLNLKTIKEDEKKEEEEVIDLDDEEQVQELDKVRETSQNPEENSDELNLNQLKEFYRRTQTEKILTTLPETETQDNFKLELRSYQKQGLTWMLRNERELENKDDGSLMNPLWKEFKWPKDRSWTVMRDESLRKDYDSTVFYANLYSGDFSLEKPILKSLCSGGILADEMGLGKTISTLALIHNCPKDKEVNASTASEMRYALNTTLIILPVSLLTQWQDEFTKANNDNSTFMCYYGSDTLTDLKHSLCVENPPLVVFTTYGTVQNEWSRLKSQFNNDALPKYGLFSVKFFRIVLDEGHNIRNRMTKTTKACYDIRASRKWLLTGTPIINRLDDLYSLVKFLELEPWSNISYWNTFITVPFEKKQFKQALDVVQSILEPVLLRRTKNMKKDGKPLVLLPPKEVVIERIKFSPKELNLYNWFLARAETSVNAGIKRGDLLKSYTTILVHILRLRQLCCHMDLIRSGSDEMDEDINSKQVLDSDIPQELLAKSENFQLDELHQAKKIIHERFDKLDDLECSICTTQPIPFDTIAFTQCGHAFCLSCILELCTYQELKGNPTLCPNCRVDISSSKLLQPKVIPNDEKGYSLYKYDNSLRSSKLNALLSHLRIIRDTSPNEKVVVFSVFSTFLDIMERELSKENGLTILKFHGKLSMEKRSETLKEFRKPKDSVTVLLLSLKAGGVGLNLTEASRAFMCDPWWSPSVEDQAIDRIHRIGQSNNVKVIRFIMEGTIEEKMLKIQERKRSIGEAVEAEEEERRRNRVEEIKTLFEST